MPKRCSQCKNFEKKDSKTVVQGTTEWGPIHENVTWDQAKKLEVDKWRLPTITELVSLFDYSTGKPKPLFDHMKNKAFWTCYTIIGYPDNAWDVNFYFGFVYFFSKKMRKSVRLIKDKK